jgi:alanine racemase
VNILPLETVSSFPDHASSRPTVAEVNLAALRHNVAQVQSLVGEKQIMGIVKANAYGHGLIRVAHELVACGVHQLGVAFVEEGIVLRPEFGFRFWCWAASSATSWRNSSSTI